MTKTLFALVLAALAFVRPPFNNAHATDHSLSEPIVKNNTAFAVKLYSQLGAGPETNLFFSPLSVSTALAMTYAGARGGTAEEMSHALHFPKDHEQLHPAFKTLNDMLAAAFLESGQNLNIANGLCLTGDNVSDGYKSLLREYYDAEIFQGGLDIVNGWVQRKTRGKIEKILERLDPNSVCVILNAVYFKGVWENRFKEEATRDAAFHISEDIQAEVRLMYQMGKFQLWKGGDFLAVSLPYKGKRMSMVVLLPGEGRSLSDLERKLTAQNLEQWLRELDRQPELNVQLFLPRYKLETGYDLIPACKALGMEQAFDHDAADFSGMGWPKGALWISQIKHRAFVEVNEEGTEAAAATAVEMATRSFIAPPVFRADRPFLFLIRDNVTGAILFMGRLIDPGA